MIAHLRHLIIIVIASLMMSIPSAFADEAQDALVEQGVVAYDAGNYERAKSILLPLAEAGHPKAMNMVGRLHDGTSVFPDDPKIECDWYEKSAIAGYISAQSNFSTCYYKGDGRTKDIDKWIYWIEKSAHQGRTLSQAALAGYYVKRDRNKYLYWAEQAIAGGSKGIAVLMWLNGDKQDVVDVSPIDIACVVVMIGWLKKPSDHCE